MIGPLKFELCRAVRLPLLFGVLLTIAFSSTTVANADEPAWWERCEELPSQKIEACFNAHNGETEPATRRPTSPKTPIRERLAERFPGAQSVFVNCPGNNSLGEYGLGCEFRLIYRGDVVKGNAAVEAESETWSHTAWWLSGLSAQPPAPQRWRRCQFRRPSGSFPEPVRLSAYGTACAEARALAGRIGYFNVSPMTLRLPRHFSVGEYQTNTLGFVVARYHCRGFIQIRQGNPNPYGHETARCRTRFGDRLTFVFNQGS